MDSNKYPPRVSRLPLVLLAALSVGMLAGCEKHGLGASSESSGSVDADLKRSITREADMSARKDAKATQTAQATSLLVGVLAAEKKPGDPADIWRYEYTQKVIAGRGTGIKLLPARDAKVDLPALQNAARRIVLSTATPLNAWPLSPFSKALETARFVDWTIQSTTFSNALLESAAKRVAPSLWRDNDEARAALLAAWNELSAEDIWDANAQAASTAATCSARLDANGQQMRFFGTCGDFEMTPAGWKVSKNGTVWFGEGFLSGKKIDVTFETSNASGLTEKRAIDSSESARAGTSGKASSEVR